MANEAGENIAIIGMSGRFPGAKNVNEFWRNIKNGIESITFFSDQELLAEGIDPTCFNDPHYVKAKGVLDHVADFDAVFFGFSPKEAQITDPQQRLFLECAWEALEDAGYDPKTYSGAIGVYGGVGGNQTYFLQNIYPNLEIRKSVGDYPLLISNDKDFLCTHVSYRLNLRGPSVTVQTACSTSLVAVIMGCRSLLDYQCDMVLAGGAAISLPIKSGYIYQEGMILSPEGRCRAFDAKAQGTVSGNGVGVVLLKRLEEALADRDSIYAVIKGTGINNDGALKVGYTAPSVEGQTHAILEALTLAEVPAETITYVETHGTGTTLGDPVEIDALTRAFNHALDHRMDKKNYCAIGSVKTNIGHLDHAAGIAGLIKTVLSLKHQLIPPSLHFETPNPKINWAQSPFYVNTQLSEWKTSGFPRRAGVSSFGIGGTNAHVVLEEAPPISCSSKSRPYQLLLLSAKSPPVLEAMTTRFVEHLKQHPHLNLADVAYTCQVGRHAFNHRRMLVCKTLEEAISALETWEVNQVFSQIVEPSETSVAFMFSGQGTQYNNMGLELYQTERIFRERVDYCVKYLQPQLKIDLRTLLYPQPGEDSELLHQTVFTQPALFITEYALAQLWMSWGVHPKAMIGHSIGEYVAACVAGVMSLEEALELVSARGRLMQSIPPGGMLVVALSEQDLRPLIQNKALDLATLNTPSQCVIAGTVEAVEQFAQQLAAQGIECQRLHTSHAFHSEMMEPILPAFLTQVRQIHLKPPKIPYISNLTGTWIEAQQATDPSYWVNHLRHTVRFTEGLQNLLKDSQYTLLEIGPGRVLSTLAKRNPIKPVKVISSLPHLKDEQSECALLLTTLGQLWLTGVKIKWSAYSIDEERYHLSLPSYPFDRQRYWIEASQHVPVVPQHWQLLVEVARRQAQQGLAKFDNPEYLEKYQWLNHLSATYVNFSLQQLGISHAQKYSLEELLTQCHILPYYYQMFPRCLRALTKLGQLQQEGEKFTHFVPLPQEHLDVVMDEIKLRWHNTSEWVELVKLCGERLVDILTGKLNPRELLFTGPAFDTLQMLYENVPEHRYFNTLMQVILGQIAKLFKGKQLRILEIGGRMGTSTAYLLPELFPQKTQYIFTDAAHSFLNQAKQKFSQYAYLEYCPLNIEKNPQEQGFEKHSFDVVIAAQVLHASKNLSRSLEYVRSLLAPQGFLILWETILPEVLYFDIAFPLLQPFEKEDILRSQHPFLTTLQWYDALRNYGFSQVEAFPNTEGLSDQVFIAQASDQVIEEEKNSQEPSLPSLRPMMTGSTYIPPRDEVEHLITELWQKCLGIEAIGIHDNFFEFGGDSLMAVQLLAQLRKVFQVELPSHSLLTTPTIATLAESIKKFNAELQFSSLIEIQGGDRNKKRSLFLVHPAGGHVYFYRDLAYSLGKEQPVYGFQAQGVDGKAQPVAHLEEMAKQYVTILRTVQPHGPYVLGGASFGGVVAFEMAQQLLILDEEVTPLIIIDAPHPNSQIPFDDEALRALMVEEHLHHFLKLGAGKAIPETHSDQFDHFLQVFKMNLESLWAYKPQPYPGKIVFFSAQQRDHFNPPHPEKGWIELALGEINVYEIPGNHITMNYSPHVQVMAERLKSYL